MRKRTQSTQTTSNVDLVNTAMQSSNHAPLKLLILPKDVSSDARICTLAHPRTLNPSRYYFCPIKGVYEFRRILASKGSRNSWLLGPQTTDKILVADDGPERLSIIDQPEKVAPGEAEKTVEEPRDISNGYILKTPELFVATPIDPLFLILPAFLTQSSSTTSSQLKKLFLSVEDLLDGLRDESKHVDQVLVHDHIRHRMEVRMISVCDMVEAGDEKMYRLNLGKLLKELLVKANNTVSLGLPASMEDKFVRKALEEPTMAVKRQESPLLEDEKVSQDKMSTSGPAPSDGTDSQSSTIATSTPLSISSTCTDITTPDVKTAERKADDLAHLLRLRTILTYLTSAYLPPFFASTLTSILSSADSPVDFTTLDKHLDHIASLKAEALASRSLSDFSRKRGISDDNDDEAAETRVEKKRKKDEEEKRKKVGESRGIRDLKKADVSGMKKMSDFFKGAGKKRSK